MVRQSWTIAWLLGACAAKPVQPPAKPVAPLPDTSMTITETAMGRLDGKSRSTLEALRGLLVGFDVRAQYISGIEYHVYKNGEHLYYVIPTEGRPLELFNVHVVSNKFSVAGKSWRASEPFRGASALTRCECWGDMPVCYRQGEHVAVAFKRGCAGLTDGDTHARSVLDGVTVQRMIWSPTEFGGNKIVDDMGTNGGTDQDDPPPPPVDGND